MLRKSSERRESTESVDMIVEMLDNSKLRANIGKIDAVILLVIIATVNCTLLFAA